MSNSVIIQQQQSQSSQSDTYSPLTSLVLGAALLGRRNEGNVKEPESKFVPTNIPDLRLGSPAPEVVVAKPVVVEAPAQVKETRVINNNYNYDIDIHNSYPAPPKHNTPHKHNVPTKHRVPHKTPCPPPRAHTKKHCECK